MSSGSAPIAIFAYARPEHFRRMLLRLCRCDGFEVGRVVVFGDGPRSTSDEHTVEAVRAIAREILGNRAKYYFADSNKGLSRSIIDGVSRLTTEYGRVIVLEDDLEVAPTFLTYMDAALDKYANDECVYQISAHMFDVPELENTTSGVFLPFTTTWGWGTWRRAWQHLDEAATGWRELRTNRSMRQRFNLNGVYDYATMLEEQMAGRRDSWGVRWYWSVFRRQGIVLYPPHSIVRNTGLDGTGSHGRGVFRRYGSKAISPSRTAVQLPSPDVDRVVLAAVRKAIWRQNGGIAGRLVDLAKALVKPAHKES